MKITNLLLLDTIFRSNVSTYNPFTYQQGYCKLQGFNTHSRNTSDGIDMFTDERIKVGVGISSLLFDLKEDDKIIGTLCGSCINLTINNFPILNNNLDVILDNNFNNSSSNMIAYITDRCEDPICLDNKGMVDLDIYVSRDSKLLNPYNVSWHIIECPLEEDNIEFVICNPNTCNIQNIYNENTIFYDTITGYGNNFITLMPRNTKYAIREMYCDNEKLEFITGLGYKLQYDIEYDMLLEIVLGDINDNYHKVYIDTTRMLDMKVNFSYGGGIIYKIIEKGIVR